MVKNNNKLLTKLAIASLLLTTSIYPTTVLVVNAEEVAKPPVTKEGLEYYVNDGNSITILGYTKNKSNAKIVIPDSIENLPVTHIADFAFNKKSIGSVKFSKNLVEIGESSFSNNQLTELTFPNSLKGIGKDAFRANVLKKVNFNNGLIKVGDNAFQANLLTEFKLPNSVTTIGDGVFNYNVGSYIEEDEDLPEDEINGYYDSSKIKVDVTNGNNNYNEDITNNENLPIKAEDENQQSMNLGLEGGELSLVSPKLSSIGIGPVQITKEPTKTPIRFDNQVTVSDLRATGEGWHLTVQASQFSEVPISGGNAPKGGWYKFPTGSITISGEPKLIPVDSTNTSAEPTSLLDKNNKAIPIDSGAVTVVSSYYNEGMGEWRIMFPTDFINLTVSSEYAKEDRLNYPNKPTPYSSTITWTLVSGPGL